MRFQNCPITLSLKFMKSSPDPWLDKFRVGAGMPANIGYIWVRTEGCREKLADRPALIT